MDKWEILHLILIIISVILVITLMVGYAYIVMLLAEKGVI